MQEHGQSSPVVVISRVDRVNHHQDTELIQFDILTSSAKLDCHLDYCLGPTQTFDWQEAHFVNRTLEGYLDFILTRELRLYLNQQEMLIILQR